jgi:hypothetical protein
VVAEGGYVGEQTGIDQRAGHYPQTEMPEKSSPVVLDFFIKSVL